MPTGCVIFDCDGTLVDSEPLGNEVFALLLREQGICMTQQEALARFVGRKLAECIAEVELESGIKLPSSFIPDLRRRTAAIFKKQLKPVVGALDLVKSLRVPICVASSGPRDKIQLSLTLTGLLPYFAGRIFSSYELGSWKPEPAIFLHAAEQLSCPPVECLVVEDSFAGVQAALAAGMHVVAFQPNARDKRIPDHVPVIRRMADLHEKFFTVGIAGRGD